MSHETGMRNGLLHDGVTYWARRTPDKLAAVMDDEAGITYAELDRWSDGIAVDLQGRGVVPGDRVSIAAANRIDWVPAAIGILKTGAIIAPFNDRLLADELAYLASYSSPRVIIADGPRAELLRRRGVAAEIVLLDDLAACRSGAPTGWSPVRVDSTATAMIIFTSGSTARPKGAMMPHGSYLAKYMEMRLLDERLGSATRALMPFGLHASPGTPWGILFSSTLGGTLHFMGRYSAERALSTLAGQRISFFIGVPMIYEQIGRLPGFDAADLSALTFARVGGAKSTPQMLDAWYRKGIAVRQLYGMTEVGGGSIIASEEEARARPGSCGRGLAYSRFRIVRDDGRDCAPDEPGLVLLQGPGMMSGYWEDLAATEAALRDGWMHTGDIGVIDDEGYFTFVDRSKEMIKSGGFNVSPSEIEAVILDLPGVREAAVFAVPDDRFAEAPCACVHAEDGVTPEQIFDHCRQRLAGFKLPRYIIPLDGPLPRLANEKVDRRRLKADYADASRLPEKLGTSSPAARAAD